MDILVNLITFSTLVGLAGVALASAIMEWFMGRTWPALVAAGERDDANAKEIAKYECDSREAVAASRLTDGRFPVVSARYDRSWLAENAAAVAETWVGMTNATKPVFNTLVHYYGLPQARKESA